jgi:hypothetical protein
MFVWELGVPNICVLLVGDFVFIQLNFLFVLGIGFVLILSHIMKMNIKTLMNEIVEPIQGSRVRFPGTTKEK